MRHRPRHLPALLLAILPLAAMAIEQPRYEVVQRAGDIEIRRYAPYLVAETWVEGGFDAAGNEGFGRLFRYITGANQARASISMTAPVAQEPASGTDIAMTAPVTQAGGADGYWVAFMVPSGFTPESVPQPTDPRVRIRVVPAATVAAYRYSGFWGEGRYRREEQQMRETLDALGFTVAGPARFARYNPPYMPPFMRRNEILLPLADANGAAHAPAAPAAPARATSPGARPVSGDG